MLEEVVRKRSQKIVELEEMVIVFTITRWYTEKRLSGDKLKDKTAEAPDIEGLVDGAGENQLRSSKAKWGEDLGRRIREEVCYRIVQSLARKFITGLDRVRTHRHPCQIA